MSETVKTWQEQALTDFFTWVKSLSQHDQDNFWEGFSTLEDGDSFSVNSGSTYYLLRTDDDGTKIIGTMLN